MEGCEEKARRTLENGRVGQEGKGRRELFQMRVAVIGFGMMGRQIAQVFAQHGHEVSVTDENPAAVELGLDEVAHGPYGIESAVAKAKITREEGTKALQQIRPAADLKEACNSADLVIEAVYEHLLLKQEVFGKLESAAPQSALLASNTSTLTVTKIGSKLSKKKPAVGHALLQPRTNHQTRRDRQNQPDISGGNSESRHDRRNDRKDAHHGPG